MGEYQVQQKYCGQLILWFRSCLTRICFESKSILYGTTSTVIYTYYGIEKVVSTLIKEEKFAATMMENVINIAK